MLNIRKYDKELAKVEYGILCQRVYPWKDVVDTPFGSLWATVQPGETTAPHNHHEGETFYIIKGQGTVTVDDESGPIEAGDVIYFSPFSTHSVYNTSETEELVFLSVWWEDMKLLAGSASQSVSNSDKVLIFATPPTPNGDLHLGHLSGPFTGADIYTRYQKIRSKQAYYLSGSDDHQSYVPLKGKQIGLAPQETANKFTQDILQTLQAAKIEMDLFFRPNQSKYHIPLTQQFVKALYESGKLIEKEMPALSCEECNVPLFEANVKGGCPHCGAGTDGNACEQCGRPNDCVDIINPVCKICGATPTLGKSVKRLYFPLSQYADQLRTYYETAVMGTHLRALCEKMLADGLPDIPVTFPSDWGIPVPVEGYEDQRIYVWFEMTPSYLAGAQQLSEQLGLSAEWGHFWKGEQTKVVQFMGFDNGYFYAVLMPALLMAYDQNIQPPHVFVTNEFYRLQNLKFSTSRGHAIWGRDFFSKVSADAARFYLSYSRPETEQTNFTIEDFNSTVQRELIDSWQTWLQELGQKVTDHYQGVIPDAGAWSASHRDFLETLNRCIAEGGEAYEAETFSPQKVTRIMCELVRHAVRFGKAENHMRDVASFKDFYRTGVALELTAAKALAILAAPIMPDFSAALWNKLGYSTELRFEETLGLVKGGQMLNDVEITFAIYELEAEKDEQGVLA